jgi:hypothetical protein
MASPPNNLTAKTPKTPREEKRERKRKKRTMTGTPHMLLFVLRSSLSLFFSWRSWRLGG